ncbi:hypothetical protein [Fontivita pretiosa]|uniref:hypothetical protein n=1 Tax=Fontivita pretiosa TaxID=2989684 RepID=UPI003D182148
MIAPSNRISGSQDWPFPPGGVAPARRGRTPPLWADIPAFVAFADEVESALDSEGILSFSQRQKLLRRARHFGIRPFDANLVIAMVQHRFQPAGPPAIRQASHASKSFNWLPTVTVIVVVQSLILAAGWWLLR